MTRDVTTWLHCAQPQPGSRHRLICFPHAGGSASFFRTWGEHIPDCEVYAVKYPGRAERFNEPQPNNLRQLAYQISEAIEALAVDTVALFGHSMGAAIALETARCLEARGVNITHLIASGSRNGTLPPPYMQTPEDDDDDTLCDQLVNMGGTDPEVTADPVFRELVLPSVRADAQMFHAYKMKPLPTLKCPVTTIYGDLDVHADIRPWRDLAAGGFKEFCVTGDHFYLISMPPFKKLKLCLETDSNIEALTSTSKST